VLPKSRVEFFCVYGQGHRKLKTYGRESLFIYLFIYLFISIYQGAIFRSTAANLRQRILS